MPKSKVCRERERERERERVRERSDDEAIKVSRIEWPRERGELGTGSLSKDY
jgi:hypothetical protein